MHRSVSPSATAASVGARVRIVADALGRGVGEGLARGVDELLDACSGAGDSEGAWAVPSAPDQLHPATAVAPTQAQMMVRAIERRLRAMADERARACTCCPSEAPMSYHPTAGLQPCRRTFRYQESQTGRRSGRSSWWVTRMD